MIKPLEEISLLSIPMKPLCTTMPSIEDMHSEAQSMSNSGNALGAIKLTCETVPTTKDWEMKELHAKSVRFGLIAGHGEMASIISDLNDEERTNLLKYVYKNMALGEDCGKLLQWHNALTEVGGLGMIARAMADRKV